MEWAASYLCIYGCPYGVPGGTGEKSALFPGWLGSKSASRKETAAVKLE